MRLDVLLVAQQHFPSREKAKMAIREGLVRVNGKPATKAGQEIEENDIVEVSAHTLLKYVSAGGFKLEKAIQDFSFSFKDKTVLDIGTSTGGFTDCALQHGASLVHAIDVGSQQLHPQLRHHPRVVSVENTDIKDYRTNLLFDVAVMDVSFTSQTPMHPYIGKMLKEDGALIALIKPQFELDQRIRLSGGIVKDKKLHLRVLRKVIDSAAAHGLFLHRITTAPLQEDKNVEYLGLFLKQPPEKPINADAIIPL